MIFKIPRIMLIVLLSSLSLLIVPATLYWLKIVYKKSRDHHPFLKRKSSHLSLLSCIFCILWLIYHAVLLSLWILHKSLHFSHRSLTYFLLYHHCIDSFIHSLILWFIFARYWLLFFHSHWTSSSLQYIWIHLRYPSRRNPRNYVDLSHVFWIKHASSLGTYCMIKRHIIKILCVIFILLTTSLWLSLRGTFSLNIQCAICFGISVIPYICIALLRCNTPSNYQTNVNFTAHMRNIGTILCMTLISRVIVFICGLYFSFCTEIVYSFYFLSIWFFIFSFLFVQKYPRETDRNRVDCLYADDIVHHIFKSEELLQIFKQHLAKEMCLQYLIFFVELTQFRHLLERIYPFYESLPDSEFTNLYEPIQLSPHIPRSTIISNRKYARNPNPKRIAKIANRLIHKYVQSGSIFEIFMNAKLKRKLIQNFEFEEWNKLLVQFEICRANIYELLTESAHRLYQSQVSSGATGIHPVDTSMDFDFLKEFVSNHRMTVMDTKQLDIATKIIYDQFMRSFPSDFKLIHLLKMNNENNINVHQSTLEAMEHKTEQILYHGTSIDDIYDVICNGFNPDSNTRPVYGKGIYFATNADTACQYCVKQQESDCFALFICRVIVNDDIAEQQQADGDKDTMRYRCDTVKQYDSIVDEVLPEVLVVNRNFKAIPEYLVTFEK